MHEADKLRCRLRSDESNLVSQRHWLCSPEVGVTGNRGERAANIRFPWHFLLTASGILMLMYPYSTFSYFKKNLTYLVWIRRTINFMKMVTVISCSVHSQNVQCKS